MGECLVVFFDVHKFDFTEMQTRWREMATRQILLCHCTNFGLDCLIGID
jgi:hypothetical protein